MRIIPAYLPATLGLLVLTFGSGCGDDSGNNQTPDAGQDAALDAAPDAAPDSEVSQDAEVDSGPPDPCEGVIPVTGAPTLTTEVVAEGLNKPVYVTAPPHDTERLFIVEQSGTIRVVRDGTTLPEPFIDLSSEISCCGERGLLGLAFHPHYATNGRLFVNYTASDGTTHVSELQVSGDPDVADASSLQPLLTVPQFAGNHNGGQIAFGPDSYLYIGMGDGGGSGDPQEQAQDPTTLLGAMLRIDVDNAVPYAIPSDNPYVGGGGAPEVFSIGLRNPWRFSFDRETGDLYIGDVGQGVREEINVTLDSSGLGNGANYGWDDCEGDLPYEATCDGFTAPALVYPHTDGCSVTGGFVYRGCRMPDLHGTYFYADYCDSWVRTFRFVNGQVTDEQDVTDALGLTGLAFEVVTFGEDAQGEVYIGLYGAGQVLRIVPAP